jgi:hypothetical protein
MGTIGAGASFFARVTRETAVSANAVNLAFVVSPRQRAPYKGVAQSMTSCENGVA